MKPIEIHIEEYKIVISKEDEKPAVKPSKKADDSDLLKKYCDIWKQPDIINVPYTPPTNTGEWWKYPTVTWTSEKIESASSENGIVTKLMKGTV